MLLRLLMIVREGVVGVRGGRGGCARRRPLLLLLLLLLRTARHTGGAGRRAGRRRRLVFVDLDPLLLLLALHLRGRRLGASGARHGLEEADERLLSSAHGLNDGRCCRVREHLSLVLHQGELVLALGVRHEALRVTETELAYEAHENRLDGHRRGRGWRCSRRRGRLFTALRASITDHPIAVHHGKIGIVLLHRRALLLLLLLLLVGLVSVQP